jgi:O-antigen ligase
VEKIEKIRGVELVVIALVSLTAIAFLCGRYPVHAPYILAALLVLAIFFLLGPFVGFLLYFPTTFIQTIPIGTYPISLNQFAGLAFVFSWLSWTWRKKITVPKSRYLGLLFLVFLYFSVSALTGEDFEAGLLHFWYLTIYLLIAIVVGSMLKDEKTVKVFFWVALVVTFVSSCIGFVEFVFNVDLFEKSRAFWKGRFRINATAPNSIVFAYNSLYAFPFGYYLFSESRRNVPRFAALAIALFINVVALFTFNRQTMILIVIEFILAALLFINKYNKLFLTLLMIMAILGAPFLINMVFTRLETIMEVSRDYSVLRRRDAFLIGMEIIHKKPLFGIGFGSFPTTWSKYVSDTTFMLQYEKREKRYPDFGYNQILSETGIVGLTIALAFFYLTMRLLVLKRKQGLAEQRREIANYASAMLVLMAVFLLASFIQDTFLYVRTWIMFGLILALSRSHAFQLKEPKKAV